MYATHAYYTNWIYKNQLTQVHWVRFQEQWNPPANLDPKMRRFTMTIPQLYSPYQGGSTDFLAALDTKNRILPVGKVNLVGEFSW